MLRAVILDFDGVVADSEPLHFKAFNKVLDGYGVQLSEQDYYSKYLGFTDSDCFDALDSDLNLNLNEQIIDKLIQRKGEVFEQLVITENSIIPGVEDFLKMLKQNNIRIAICSGASLSDIELMLEGSNLRICFEVIVAADHIRKGKPDPEGFLLTLAKLNKTEITPIAVNECVIVEDSHWGLEAAKAAGMRTLAVTNTYPSEELQSADKITESLAEVTLEDLKNLCD